MPSKNWLKGSKKKVLSVFLKLLDVFLKLLEVILKLLDVFLKLLILHFSGYKNGAKKIRKPLQICAFGSDMLSFVFFKFTDNEKCLSTFLAFN
jgi:hypothetical protein